MNKPTTLMYSIATRHTFSAPHCFQPIPLCLSCQSHVLLRDLLFLWKLEYCTWNESRDEYQLHKIYWVLAEKWHELHKLCVYKWVSLSLPSSKSTFSQPFKEKCKFLSWTTLFRTRVIQNPRYFKVKLIPLHLTVTWCELGYIGTPLFRTIFHVLWNFEIAGFDCSANW